MYSHATQDIIWMKNEVNKTSDITSVSFFYWLKNKPNTKACILNQVHTMIQKIV